MRPPTEAASTRKSSLRRRLRRYALRNPIRYREAGRSVAESIPGTVLRRILSVWVRAHHAGVLGPSQERVAQKAQILLDGLADTAIDAF
jgi:hypothetical protein